MGNWVAAKNHAGSVVNAAVAAQAPPIFSPSLDLLESRYGFGMGSEQPKRCRGRWPCHRTPKGTAGMGGETNYEKREMHENPSRWAGLRRVRPGGGLTSGGGRGGGGSASLQRSMLVSWRGTSLSAGVRGGWLRFQLETPPSRPPDRAVAAPCGVRRHPSDGGRIAFPRCRCGRHKRNRWSNAGCRQTRSWLNSALRLARLAQGIRRVLSEWPAMSQ